MRFLTSIRRYRLQALSGVVSIALVAAWISGLGTFREVLRENAFDILWPWLARPAADPSVIVVDIDRDTLVQHGAWPWPRSRLAHLIEAVAGAKPRVIGIDILLARKMGTGSSQAPDDKDSDPDDIALARALGLAPTVLGFVLDDTQAGSDLPSTPMVFRGQPSVPYIWTADSVVGPSPALAAAAKGFGAIVLTPDVDGLIRRVPLLVQTGQTLRAGIAAELLRVSFASSGYVIEESPPSMRIGPLTAPLDRDAQLRVFPITDFWASRTISATQVLNNPVSRERLAGRIVLIGSGAPEVGGLRVTPASAATPSVQIQGDAIELLRQSPLPSRPAYAEGIEDIMAAALAIFAALLTLWARPIGGAILLLLGCTAWSGAAVAAFWTQGVMLDPLGPVAVTVASFGLFSLTAFAINEAQARALRHRFEQHLAPAVVKRLVENPELLKLEGESREITAMFTDIEGFTAMTEHSEARKLVALLDEYLDALTDVILAHGGMVDKIVGDGVIAVFNAPLDLPDHPRHALECALAILKVSEEIRGRPLAKELGLGRTRIGIETGPVIIGDVGGKRKLEYTANGSAMNTASRLEGANKELGSSICIGPIAAARLDPQRIRSLGRYTVRGREHALEVFTVV